MKKKIWVGIILAGCFVGLLIFSFMLSNRQENQIQKMTQKMKLEDLADMQEAKTTIPVTVEETAIPAMEEKKIGGYGVIGTLTIPKIDLEKKILEKSDEKSLKLGIAKICGPNINQEGNFCIVGHNYQSSFGKLKRLEIGDTFLLTDPAGRSVTYVIDQIEKVSPQNTECLAQNTKGDREATLITCTLRCFAKVSNQRNRTL